MAALGLLLSLATASAFNIDTGSVVVHSGPRETCDSECMFGFAVAQHKEAGVPWLLVGAPEADTRQPGVHKGGAVYKCSASRPGDCSIIPFDTKGPTMAPTGQQYDSKSGQWLGSTLDSSGEDGTILACAPRYVWYSRNYKRREPIGTCFTAKNNFADYFEYSPCRTRKWGYHRQGSCQAGLGASVADNGEQLFIGAVGSWYWQGQTFSFNFRRPRNQSMTQEGSPQDDDSYLGYSTTTGEFNGDGDRLDVAVGMPRGANLTGKVVLYNANLTNLNNVTGDQIGAYFGYSLASCDVNGDGLDDLLIGSPMWTDYSVMDRFETGRVYVVYQDKQHRFRTFDTLTGETHKARFGISVASLGDINLDGFQDLAVGAPYGGREGRGAVYVFLGSREGVVKKPSQVIMAADLNTPSLRTFGWSISGGLDMDSNQYPDMLVGAYSSGHAVYMKAAPVVHMVAKVSFDRQSKQIDLEDQQCTLRDRTRVPCVQVSVSLQYTGVGVPNKLDFSLDYLLDAKKEKQKRLFMLSQEGTSTRSKTISMLKDREFKETFKVYLPGSQIHDKLTSLEVQLRYALGSTVAVGPGLPPVLGHGEHLVTDSINIQKECGADNICVPNLSIQSSGVESYLMGSGERLEVQTQISNQGEDAFNALLEVQLPRGVSYINANTSEPGLNILCSAPKPLNNYTLQCDVGNPLRANSEITVRVFVQPSSEGLEEAVSEFSFAVRAKSSNPEAGGNNFDNERIFTVPIRVETDFRVTGKSEPAEMEYNISAPLPSKYVYEDEIGDIVNHIYDVKNKGPSSISEAMVHIFWPSFNDNGEHLLYLLGFEYDQKKAVCEQIKNLNPLAVKTEGSRDYGTWSAHIGQQDLEGYIETRGGSTYSSAGQSGYSSSSSSSFSSSSTSFQSSGSASAEREEYGGRGGVASGGSFRASSSGSFGGMDASYGSEGSLAPPPALTTRRPAPPPTRRQQIMAEGAEETRLFDTQGQPYASSEVGRQASSSSSSSVQSSSSSSNAGSSDSGSSSGGEIYSGWRMLDNGTYIRVYDSQRAAGAASSQGSSGMSASQINSGSAESSSRSYQGSSGISQVSGASQGSRGYEVSMGVGAGGSLDTGSNTIQGSTSDSGSSNTGWVRQPDGTFVRKSSSWSSQSSGSQHGGGRHQQGGARQQQQGGGLQRGGQYEGSDTDLDSAAPQGNIQSGNIHSGSYFESGARGSAGSVSQGSHGASSYGSVGSSSQSFQGSSSRVIGESNQIGGQGIGGIGVLMGAAQGPGDYHGTMSRAELEREAGGRIFNAAEGTETHSQVENTRYQGSSLSSGSSGSYGSSGSSGSYGSSSGSSGYSSGSSQQSSSSSGAASSSSTLDSNDVVETNGGKWVWSEVSQKWEWEAEAGAKQAQAAVQDSGSSDSGWTMLPNGTWARKTSSWSSHTQTSSGSGELGGVGTGVVLPGGGEQGHHGSNDTGWITRPDGTMVKKTSAWASWSSSSHDGLSDSALEDVQRGLEQRVRNHLPGNVEPGYEQQWQSRARSRRSIAEFESELASCGSRCTVIKCTIGPLEKDESVLFKIRSRLFTETQVKNYAEKVKISSKLVTRVTRLPFLVPEEHLAFQSHSVTTTVIPSEPGEMGIPWWVWFLAAIGGCLLLALITYCLYKCGFFKRRRPEDGPESEPLQSNGY